MNKCHLAECPNQRMADSYFCSEECRNIYWQGAVFKPNKLSADYLQQRIARLKQNAPIVEEIKPLNENQILSFFTDSEMPLDIQ